METKIQGQSSKLFHMMNTHPHNQTISDHTVGKLWKRKVKVKVQNYVHYDDIVMV